MPGLSESIGPHEVHSVDMALSFFCPASPRYLQRKRSTPFISTNTTCKSYKEKGYKCLFFLGTL